MLEHALDERMLLPLCGSSIGSPANVLSDFDNYSAALEIENEVRRLALVNDGSADRAERQQMVQDHPLPVLLEPVGVPVIQSSVRAWGIARS